LGYFSQAKAADDKNGLNGTAANGKRSEGTTVAKNPTDTVSTLGPGSSPAISFVKARHRSSAA
jgi:hypothetical protein